MPAMPGMSSHGTSQLSSAASTDSGMGHSMGGAMLLYHATAVVVSWLLVMVGEAFSRLLKRWLRGIKIPSLRCPPRRFGSSMWPG